MSARPLVFKYLIPILINGLILPASHADILIRIEDQAHQPLQNAVIEIIPSTDEVLKTDVVAVIDQVDKRFKPDFLVINKGQSVDFPNSDNIRHHVYSFSKAKVFELKLYADKPEKPVNFAQHGVVVLGCNIHDTMLGYVYVANSSQTYVSNEKGEIVLPDLKPETQLNIWHAHQQQGPEYLPQVTLADLLLSDTTASYTIVSQPPQPRHSFGDVFGAID
jgi:plastocyanin